MAVVIAEQVEVDWQHLWINNSMVEHGGAAISTALLVIQNS